MDSTASTITTETAHAPAPGGERTLRADARRNRDAVLVAARDRLAKDGLDGPIEEIARAAGADLLEIPPEEFGHGRTRNLGAERSSGDLICFLTQDAVPVEGWLDAYREAFALDERVGADRVLPRLRPRRPPGAASPR